MFRTKMTSCNVLKSAVTRANFGAILQTSRVARMANTGDNSCDKENISTNENHRKSSSKENKDFMLGNILKEKNAITNDRSKTDTSKVGSQSEIIKQMLKTEEHHVIEVIEDKQGNLSDVFWCPVYLRPDAKGRARGSDEIPHHRCKTCARIGLHLLNDGQKYRPCLVCAGWSEAEIPAWYYHITCHHCEHALKP